MKPVTRGRARVSGHMQALLMPSSIFFLILSGALQASKNGNCYSPRSADISCRSDPEYIGAWSWVGRGQPGVGS